MTYPIGSIVWGDRLIRCEVLKIQHKKSTGEIRYQVRCPGGNRFIHPSDIRGYEPPTPIQVGDRVCLKNTTRSYVVQSIYQVRCDSEGNTEDYCKLITATGSIATWKLSQLRKETPNEAS